MNREPSQPTDSRFLETLVKPEPPSENNEGAFSKEQRDIALATHVLQTGVLNERQLSAALGTWTIHGSVPLADHLRQEGLLDEEACSRLLNEAEERLARATDIASHNGAGTRSVVLVTLDVLDPSGTIARLLGIRAIAGVGASDATGERQATARYQLVRKLGQGGLGRVWLAFDHSLKRHVAVKEITAKDDPQALDRFRREAEITGRLEHPGIVPLHQLGDDSRTGEVFYAMRFLGRKTMHDVIAEYHERRMDGEDDPMLIRRLLTDFVSVCQAIGHAHSRKVIHRDLKPENIAIDSFGQVIVIDWGIAKVLDDVSTSERTFSGDDPSAGASTMEGQVLGTPLYMAPEQAAGRIDELDERTDIYGLGAILFSILTGYAPHEHTRESASATTGRQLLAAIASRPAPMARQLNPNANPALTAICAKAMARRQYARYQTASQLADDVQRWMAGEPVSAYREKPSQRVARWVGQHRIWSQVMAAIFTVAVVALATFAIVSWREAQAARDVRLDEMRGYQREIELQVKSTAEELSKDARFMSTLPPVQGIIDARNRVAKNGTEPRSVDEDKGETETEEVWRERLASIFEGLLRANPNYLATSYVVQEGDEAGTCLVRVERNISDASYLRRVPLSRLGPFPHPDLLEKTAALPPGETLLAISAEHAATSHTLGTVQLIAATPVYDEQTGSLFGIVAVEANFLARLSELVETIEHRNAVVTITDASGSPWLRDGMQQIDAATPTEPFAQDPLRKVVGDLQAGGRGFEDRGQGLIAKLVRLSPANPETAIGIVLQLRGDGE